ncbi:MAG: hypothetical protein F8N38_11475 [Hungatella sp.]|nr:hypothetical protein [Hungatella sp.]
MEIKIPERFIQKMGDELSSECNSVLKKFENFANIDMYFFPEYTDHSNKHIQYVLETANNLIPDYTLDLLSSVDIFVLCLSILYHDLGMHVTTYSIKALYQNNPIDALIEKDFRKIWKEYIELNDDKQYLILADLEKIGEDEIDLYKGFIAGFVRTNHSFLAEVIAQKGFPIKRDDDTFSYENYNEKSRKAFYDLSGIIARSHGVDLRIMINYLKKEYGEIWKTPYGAHAVYLMCIVRVADYLHITNDRISKYRLNLNGIRSDRSKVEYLKHQSVEYSQAIYDNPETIYIEVNPQNCNIFLEMVELINDIQRELDSSWAVLGEVYGMSKLSLSIRRITSNVLSENWQSQSPFVPGRFKFHFDIRLVDLLIEPLYGNSASYGIRELIQNATDACKARKALNKENDIEYIPMVTININDSRIIITDNGTGMSLDIIKNHFLNIGSKFKDSIEWKNSLDSKQEDTENSNQMERNGKFGIGILSSFLLGNRIKVKTCSLSENIEYMFETEKNTKSIEINKIDKNEREIADYGTRIEIILKDEININELVISDWYKCDDVEIEVKINNDKMKISNLVNFKNEPDEKINWHELEINRNNDFSKVLWTYDYKINSIQLKGKSDEKPETYYPNLICNGILIPSPYDKKVSTYLIATWPTLFISDKKGVIDLNLSRDEINGNLPFIKDLEKVLMKQYIEKIFKIPVLSDKGTVKSDLKDIVIKNYNNQILMFGKKGYSIYNNFFIHKIQPQKILRIWTKNSININVDDFIESDTYYIFEGLGYHPGLKSRIVNYREKSFSSYAKIYLYKDDHEYYCYAASTRERLREDFRNSSVFAFLDEVDVKKQWGLEIDKENITLIIEYSNFYDKEDGSIIFDDYFSDNYTIPYHHVNFEVDDEN